jgi:hypothetical protein
MYCLGIIKLPNNFTSSTFFSIPCDDLKVLGVSLDALSPFLFHWKFGDFAVLTMCFTMLMIIFFYVSLLIVYDFLPEPWIAYIFPPLSNLFVNISNTFKIPFQNVCNITCFHHSFLQDVQCALNLYHFLFMPKVMHVVYSSTYFINVFFYC